MKDEQFLSKYIQDEYETFTKSELLEMLKEYRKFLLNVAIEKVTIDKSKTIVRKPIMVKEFYESQEI